MKSEQTEVVAGILFRDGQVLICQRRENDRFPLQWEFPGGKVKPDEDPEIALEREMVEELAIDVKIDSKFMQYTYRYPDGPEILLRFYLIREYVPEPLNRQFHRVEWVPIDALGNYDFLEGDEQVINRLERTFTHVS